MSRISFDEGNWRKDPCFKAICIALAECKDADQVADFLRDVGTLTELKAWSERFQVAKLIAQGETYREIMKKTGASTTTVTRVARFLTGGEGGYRRVLNAKQQHHHHTTSRGERMVSMAR